MMPELITTQEDWTGAAPPSDRWAAWFGDYDLGVTVGAGPTEFHALVDLLAQWEPTP